MSTWISDRVAACLSLCLLTAACEGGGPGAATSEQGFANPRRNMALPSAQLAGGAVTLAPPAGFCVDRRSLEPSFAIVARCDSLGARAAVPDAPLGMILVSVTPAAEPELDLAAALEELQPQGTQRLASRVSAPLALMQLAGPTPEGIDRRHWRAVAQIGPNLLGLTAFAPTGGELSGQAGGHVLEQLVNRTDAATATEATVTAASAPGSTE